jgi:hypothetical protein
MNLRRQESGNCGKALGPQELRKRETHPFNGPKGRNEYSEEFVCADSAPLAFPTDYIGWEVENIRGAAAEGDGVLGVMGEAGQFHFGNYHAYEYKQEKMPQVLTDVIWRITVPLRYTEPFVHSFSWFGLKKGWPAVPPDADSLFELFGAWG